MSTTGKRVKLEHGIGRRVVRTMIANHDGGVRIGAKVTAASGFSNLMNLFSPPVLVKGTGPGEITQIGFQKVGRSLASVMKSASERFGG